MTRREFVRKAFLDKIQTAIQGMENSKGRYHQYIDSWDYDLTINFEVCGNVVVGEIHSERDVDNPFTKNVQDYRGYAKIETSLEEALVELVEYAQVVTGYKPAL